MTWHSVDEEWRLKSVLIAVLVIGLASKSAEELCCIMKDIIHKNSVIGLNCTRVPAIKSDNKVSVLLSRDLLTNFVGSVHYIVHTTALAATDVFVDGSLWQLYLNQVSKVTTYFNQHKKVSVLLL